MMQKAIQWSTESSSFRAVHPYRHSCDPRSLLDLRGICKPAHPRREVEPFEQQPHSAMVRSLVTGGSGFLGRHLVEKLLAHGSHVVVFDLHEYVHEDATQAERVTSCAGTITQLGDVVSACRDVDVVYHCVSANPLDNRNEALMWSVNVEGTKNVIEACKQCRVERLVYVSSASVVFDGHHMIDVDETKLYPTKYIDFYSKTKGEAEKLVLAANRDFLRTCAIRPSAIFGERDPALVPRLVEAGRAGKTKYIIGNGKTKWEFTYVGNVADACIKAAETLVPGSPVAGQAYFITNDETTLFWEQCGVILGGLGYPVPSVCIPFVVCFVIAVLIELVLLLLSPIYKPKKPPTFSRQRVVLLTSHRKISCAKAKRDFGYAPKVSMDEGMRRTIEYFQPLAKDEKSSKSE